MRATVPLIIMSSFVFTACTTPITITTNNGTSPVQLSVEIADTPNERALGLMERTEMEPNTGMLFVFPKPQMLQFWMKNTLIPLEILFFDADGAFVSASVMEPCTTDPCPRYSSAALAQFALEVAPGFRDAYSIGVGSILDVKDVMSKSKPE